MRTIALLTDFGLADPYVGQMKGVLASAPEARVVDLTHGVPAFDLTTAGFFLEASRPHFPRATIFICVVDPGVGGARKLICLEKFDQIFIAPDNGLLTFPLAAPGEAKAHIIQPERIGIAQSSSTFHGRDIFAPAAIKLAHGAIPADLGPAIDPDSLVRLPGATPRLLEVPAPGLVASVLHVDRFGNVILNIPLSGWPGMVSKWTGGVRLAGLAEMHVRLVQSYEDLGEDEIGLIAGSQGFVELSMNRASAAEQLFLSAGDEVAFKPVGHSA